MSRLYLTPWAELDQPTRRMIRTARGVPNGGSLAAPGWTPAVSVEEGEEGLLITAELPGLDADQVELHIENDVLTLRGEKRETRTEDQEPRRYHLWERAFGRFQRSFTLPRTVKAEEITAEFEQGLLRIRLPKAPEARSRRIPVAGRAQAGSSKLDDGTR
jgi:HSP20 family protein